jgi:cytosine/adenosine deaminase-related metal-dependent hydrolase
VCHDDTLKGYMRSIRFLRARVYRPEDMRVGNHVGMLEAINAGITTVFDFSHCINSPDHATAAVHGLHDAGARAVFAYGFNEVPLDRPGFPDPNARFDDMRRIRRELLPDDGALVTMAAAPSDLLICGIDRLRDEIEEARTLGLRISIHANTWEFPEREPEIALLQRQGLLGPDLLFVHTNLSADEEIQMIADSGGSIVSTPETEMQMSMGPSVVGRFRAAGGLPTLGCDIISNNSGDLLVQARLALQTQRMLDNALVLAKHEGAEHVSMTTHEMLRAMTTNAARALGMDDRIGALAPGREADVILVRLDDINTMPLHDPAATLLLHAHPGNVDTVLVRGRALKRNGRLVADLETARRRLLESHAYIVDAIARIRTTLPSGYRGD